MPPRKAESGHGEFVGQERLAAGDIAVIQRWVDEGASEGHPNDLPPRPAANNGWQLGTPDLIVRTPEYTLTRRRAPTFSGSSSFRCRPPRAAMSAGSSFVPATAPFTTRTYGSPAAALASTGDFAGAVSAAEAAVEIAHRLGTSALAEQIRDRLAVYRRGQPYRR